MTTPAFRLARSELNFYAESGLDRASERRRDAAWVEAQWRRAGTVIVPVWRSRNLVDPAAPRPLFVEVGAGPVSLADSGEPVFLGLAAETAYFALDLSHIEADAEGASLARTFDAAASFLDLRLVGPRLERHQGGLLAYARGMLTWHRRHLFCGQCGRPTRSAEGGHLRVCTDAACALEQFPRTDPAVIMLVTRGDKCLLGRGARFPGPFYSTLAGFVEPGETLEHAVAREVFEEAGIRVRDVRYHSSQPWPFPTSLMLGFYAEAESDALAIDPKELIDARWCERGWLSAVSRGEAGEDFRLPRADSIARRLIEDWIEGA
jgi:NAD+ diphosphatase